MRMVARVTRVGGLVLALTVAGCGGGPPWVVGATPERITLRWYPSEVNHAAAAEQVAERHCAASGKSAELASYKQSGSAELAEYRCR